MQTNLDCEVRNTLGATMTRNVCKICICTNGHKIRAGSEVAELVYCVEDEGGEGFMNE